MRGFIKSMTVLKNQGITGERISLKIVYENVLFMLLMSFS